MIKIVFIKIYNVGIMNVPIIEQGPIEDYKNAFKLANILSLSSITYTNN